MNPLEFVFKKVDDLEISLDVYLPASATKENPASVCLWWHGGGLFQGTRKVCPPNMLTLPETSNIAFISADYRLAPQSNINLILEDTVDAVKFIRQILPGLVEDRINPEKLAVSGGSAGGWLALLAGIPLDGQPGSVTPPVTCMVGIYPITDVDTDFYTRKQRPVSYWPAGIIPDAQAEPHLDPSSPALVSSGTTSPRSIVYHYALQEALWHHLWFTNSPTQSPTSPTDPKAFNISSRISQAKEKNIALPPVFIASGTADDKVDPRGAAELAKQLTQAGYEFEWDEREGADHLFDQVQGEGMVKMHAFLKRCLD